MVFHILLLLKQICQIRSIDSILNHTWQFPIFPGLDFPVVFFQIVLNCFDIVSYVIDNEMTQIVTKRFRQDVIFILFFKGKNRHQLKELKFISVENQWHCFITLSLGSEWGMGYKAGVTGPEWLELPRVPRVPRWEQRVFLGESRAPWWFTRRITPKGRGKIRHAYVIIISNDQTIGFFYFFCLHSEISLQKICPDCILILHMGMEVYNFIKLKTSRNFKECWMIRGIRIWQILWLDDQVWQASKVSMRMISRLDNFSLTMIWDLQNCI